MEKRMFRTISRVLLASVVLALSAAASQAQQSTTSTQSKNFEVIAVDGSQLVVRLAEGTRELTVPDDFRFTVDGRQLSVSELKPGMKGTATITTRTTVTPVTVTEIKNGTVMQAGGGSIVVKTDQGFKMFTQGDVDKRGVKILRDGQPAQISDFRENDRLTATIITEKPPRIMTERQVNATLARPAAPAAAATTGTVAPSASAGTAEPAVRAAPRKLPKTASSWPVLWGATLLSLAIGLMLTIRRRATE
jgi:LPXTG-motif cell wall-anchored protein